MADSDNDINDAKSKTSEVKKEKSISMHEDIPVWYDCCSCEAEPYWIEAMNAVVPDKKSK